MNSLASTIGSDRESEGAGVAIVIGGFRVVCSRLPAEAAGGGLKQLVLSGGALSPRFQSGVKSYGVTTADEGLVLAPTGARAADKIAVRINGGAFVDQASGKWSGVLPLKIGRNAVDIRVRGEGGSEKVYAVEVTRLDTKAQSRGGMAWVEGGRLPDGLGVGWQVEGFWMDAYDVTRAKWKAVHD